MSRLKIAISGIGPVAAVPLTIMTLREFMGTLLYHAGPAWPFELASVGCACAAILALNVALLVLCRPAGVVRLFVAHVMLAPFAAWSCYFGTADPVALVVALPLVAAVVMTLGASSCRLRRFAGSR